MGKKFVAICLILMLSFSVEGLAYSRNDLEEFEEQNVYIYPIIPGTDDWKELSSLDEMILVSQIPDEKIEKMSTEELLQSILSCPIIYNYIFYESYQDGMDFLVENLNSIQAFLNREDADEAIIRAYDEISNSTQNRILADVNDEEKYVATTLQLLFLRQEIQAKVSEKEIEEFSQCVKKEGGFGKLSTYANAKKLEYVYTPRGSRVAVYSNSPSLTDSEYQEQINIAQKQFPNASVYGAPNSQYNCHSYAWYQQSINNPYCMYDPSAYMNDESYFYVARGSWGSATRLYYPNVPGGHSAYVKSANSNSAFVTSKWGVGCLMYHSYNYCPYSSTGVRGYKYNPS